MLSNLIYFFHFLSFYLFPWKKGKPSKHSWWYSKSDIWFCASVFCCLLCSVLVPLQCPPPCCRQAEGELFHVWQSFKPSSPISIFSSNPSFPNGFSLFLCCIVPLYILPLHFITGVVWYALNSFYSNFVVNFSLVKVFGNGVELISYANVFLLRRKEAVSFTFSI